MPIPSAVCLRASTLPTYSWFEHPNRVCMSYWTHALHSLGLAWLLGWASVRAAVHAVVPSWYVTSTTDCVAEVLRLLVDSECPEVVEAAITPGEDGAKTK